ncbi:hypothetical protein CONLIGDRAFT_417289 [Coniochaeta ligniaria NRRL 30616]|uniref:Uncharacterized protein n=1 Tax=Coniochaeta ligniaria NRRL 30616 TaxID=1408157 RepID=A0A1J7JHT5_9PEZI|nr:hypothetical protein CONLIGDRAFT_417289 [Coniochaeta ligniaria NRRL 30616]
MVVLRPNNQLQGWRVPIPTISITNMLPKGPNCPGLVKPSTGKHFFAPLYRTRIGYMSDQEHAQADTICQKGVPLGASRDKAVNIDQTSTLNPHPIPFLVRQRAVSLCNTCRSSNSADTLMLTYAYYPHHQTSSRHSAICTIRQSPALGRGACLEPRTKGWWHRGASAKVLVAQNHLVRFRGSRLCIRILGKEGCFVRSNGDDSDACPHHSLESHKVHFDICIRRNRTSSFRLFMTAP